jgi:hypothetical protein
VPKGGAQENHRLNYPTNLAEENAMLLQFLMLALPTTLLMIVGLIGLALSYEMFSATRRAGCIRRRTIRSA